jgi:pantetheine-phosphate adenylyltransferase
MRVCVGGTFNRFHKGHKLLIDTAIKKAGCDGFVFIGLSNGPLVKDKSFVEGFEKRRHQILSFLQSKNQKKLPTIVIEPIETVEGPTLSMDFDGIVVSEETKKTAEHINQKRKNKGLPEMKIWSIPLVLAEDDKKISSTRILDHEIDSNGHLL